MRHSLGQAQQSRCWDVVRRLGSRRVRLSCLDRSFVFFSFLAELVFDIPKLPASPFPNSWIIKIHHLSFSSFSSFLVRAAREVAYLLRYSGGNKNEKLEKLGKFEHCRGGAGAGGFREGVFHLRVVANWLAETSSWTSVFLSLPVARYSKMLKYLPSKKQHFSEKHLLPSGMHSGFPVWQFFFPANRRAECDTNHNLQENCVNSTPDLFISEIDFRQEHNINTCITDKSASDAMALSSVTHTHTVLTLAHTHLPLSTNS